MYSLLAFFGNTSICVTFQYKIVYLHIICVSHINKVFDLLSGAIIKQFRKILY